MTVVVILAATMIWGIAQWPRFVRWNLRLIGVCGGLLLLMGALHVGGAYIERFASYGGWQGAAEGGPGRVERVMESLSRTCRGRMYGGAIRAWQAAPWFGIGPGMHQNLWPHYAPTADGDRNIGKWPTLVNDHLHSYEVHSDWLQLLEEYGVIGLLLFLIPFFAVSGLLSRLVLSAGKRWRSALSLPEDMGFTHVVGALLAVVAMAFHSLGDFNLQMPATVWVLAALVAIPLAEMTDVDEPDDS